MRGPIFSPHGCSNVAIVQQKTKQICVLPHYALASRAMDAMEEPQALLLLFQRKMLTKFLLYGKTVVYSIKT